MGIFKVGFATNGEINHICEEMVDGLDTPGMVISGEALAREMLTDLGAYNETNYYNPTTELFLERPESTATLSKTTLTADATDSILIAGIPEASGVFPAGQVFVDGIEYAVETGGTFEFGTDLAGTYTVLVTAFPYLDATWEVTAT